MKDEKQQIEEMARFMCANYDGERGLCGDGVACNGDCWAYREATHLYNAGYRKQGEVIDEFAKRLKERLFSVPTVYNSHFGRMIDDIAKEMKGGAG